MNLKDHIGSRGESIFHVLITEWCGGRPLSFASFPGDKHPTIDFRVELINPLSGHAQLYVQVRSTVARYKGRGSDKRLDVRVSRRDVEKLKTIRAPTYVVGIDVEKKRGYITGITRNSTAGISGVPTRNILNCRTLKLLWNEVDDFWKARDILAQDSRFSRPRSAR